MHPFMSLPECYLSPICSNDFEIHSLAIICSNDFEIHALAIICRQNVGWSSTCNTVGQTAGFFLGNVIFLALESADFCNNYLRSESKDEGIVTLSSKQK